MTTVTARGGRLIEAIANGRRVCCCICPVASLTHHAVCALFIEAGDLVVLERVGDRYAARCVPCAKVLDTPKATALQRAGSVVGGLGSDLALAGRLMGPTRGPALTHPGQNCGHPSVPCPRGPTMTPCVVR